jgi:hypothetical protein
MGAFFAAPLVEQIEIWALAPDGMCFQPEFI